MHRRTLFLRLLGALCLAAVPLGLAVSAATAGTTTSYEAESTANTLTGGARIGSCACSGGHKVGFIGHGGTLRFNGVAVSTGGTYSLAIAYLDGDAGRSASMSVNGSSTRLRFSGTGGWNVVGTLTTTVQLNAGSGNTIAFSNATAWAPDIDRITIGGGSPTPVPTSTPRPTPTPTGGGGGGKTIHAFVTLYGFVDNSPPSAIISNPQIHKTAGGTGNFADPVTFATDVREAKPGTIVYDPFLKKYFIMEDTCTECQADWNNGHKYRIDMWAGGDKNSLHEPEKSALLNCENALTQDAGTNVIFNAPAGLAVDTTPIFNASTLKCWTPH
jgi:hypothetical protein